MAAQHPQSLVQPWEGARHGPNLEAPSHPHGAMMPPRAVPGHPSSRTAQHAAQHVYDQRLGPAGHLQQSMQAPDMGYPGMMAGSSQAWGNEEPAGGMQPATINYPGMRSGPRQAWVSEEQAAGRAWVPHGQWGPYYEGGPIQQFPHGMQAHNQASGPMQEPMQRQQQWQQDGIQLHAPPFSSHPVSHPESSHIALSGQAHLPGHSPYAQSPFQGAKQQPTAWQHEPSYAYPAAQQRGQELPRHFVHRQQDGNRGPAGYPGSIHVGGNLLNPGSTAPGYMGPGPNFNPPGQPLPPIPDNT